MNINPNAIKVLCYGDSNTWGQKPDKSGRYAADVRWTGKLQQLLGDDYYIVEEGLGSRSTDLDYDRKPGRNGKTYLMPCLESHTPTNVVVLMLGTNDLKVEYGRSSNDVARALGGLVADINRFSKDQNGDASKIILVSPILIDSTAPRFTEFYTGYYDERAMLESKKLAAAIASLAQDLGCEFVDAATVSEPGEDGIHLSEESHSPLAEVLRTAIGRLRT